MEEAVVFTKGVSETFVFFCKLSEPNRWFSNWYPSNFLADGKLFSSVEQYMMWSKACLMGDHEIARMVMEAEAPAAIKALGRKVKNYDEGLWGRERRRVVYEGCLAKFQQDGVLRQKLLATGKAALVEAASYDKIWGVGLGKQDARILDRKTWLGENLLGEVLMDVRAHLV